MAVQHILDTALQFCGWLKETICKRSGAGRSDYEIHYFLVLGLEHRSGPLTRTASVGPPKFHLGHWVTSTCRMEAGLLGMEYGGLWRSSVSAIDFSFASVIFTILC